MSTEKRVKGLYAHKTGTGGAHQVIRGAEEDRGERMLRGEVDYKTRGTKRN